MPTREKKINYLINLAVIAMSLIVIILLRELFSAFLSRFYQAFLSILLPFSIALFISYLIAPIFNLLEKRFKQRNRLINTGIVYAGMLVLIFLFVRFAGNIIYDQGLSFIQNDWPRILDIVRVYVSDSNFLSNIYESIVALLDVERIDEIDIDLVSVFQSITNIIITIVLVPVFLFFLLNDRERIYDSMVVVFPKKWRRHVIELSKRAHKVTTEYFNGRFVTMFIMSIIFMIVFFILGFRERSLLFGFMMGFFDVVPYVGPFIAMTLPVLYSLTDDTLLFGDYAPLAILIIVAVGQLIQNNVAQPLIMGRETKLHPLLVLSSFVFFGYLFGIVGIILAIPITGMIKSTVEYIKEIHAEKFQERKDEIKQLREGDTSDSD